MGGTDALGSCTLVTPARRLWGGLWGGELSRYVSSSLESKAAVPGPAPSATCAPNSEALNWNSWCKKDKALCQFSWKWVPIWMESLKKSNREDWRLPLTCRQFTLEYRTFTFSYIKVTELNILSCCKYFKKLALISFSLLLHGYFLKWYIVKDYRKLTFTL